MAGLGLREHSSEPSDDERYRAGGRLGRSNDDDSRTPQKGVAVQAHSDGHACQRIEGLIPDDAGVRSSELRDHYLEAEARLRRERDRQ